MWACVSTTLCTAAAGTAAAASSLPQVLQSLEQPAIDQTALPIGFQQVFRAGDRFGGAVEGESDHGHNLGFRRPRHNGTVVAFPRRVALASATLIACPLPRAGPLQLLAAIFAG